MTPLQIALTILLYTIIAFLSGKIPFSITSAGIILTLILTGAMKPAEALGGFISTNMVMFVVMFVIGVVLTKISPLDRVQKLVVRYKNNPKMLTLISSLVAGLLACLTSATAMAVIMIPLSVGAASEIGTNRSRMLFPTMAIANIATATTFLGQGVSNMTWSDVMIKAGAPIPFSIWDFTAARIPTLLTSLAYMVFIGYRPMSDIDNPQFSDNIQKKDTASRLTPLKEKVVVILILGTTACMLLESVTGIKMYLAASIEACPLALYGALSKCKALGSIHQSTMFLSAGALALLDVIKIIGAGNVVADWMISLPGNTTNPYVIVAVFFIIPSILTQVMSNLATVTIFVPSVAAACIKTGVDPRAAIMGVFIASCTPILAPTVTPCQIMIMGPGGYSLKDYLKRGTPSVVMITIVCIFTLPIMLPSY